MKQLPKTITDALASGDRREMLVALRDRIVSAMDEPRCAPPTLAVFARQLMALTKLIDELDDSELPTKGSPGALDHVAVEAFDASAI